MDLKTYQKEAHSTACHGKGFVYPFCALAEEAGEVASVFGSYVAPIHADDGKYWHTVREKLQDELGDVMWDIAEIATLSQYNLDFIFDNHVEKNPGTLRPQPALFRDVEGMEWVESALANRDIAALIHALPAAVGKLCGIFAKFIRKHDGCIPMPENEQPWLFAQENEDDVAEFYDDVFDWLGKILHLVYRIAQCADINFDTILIQNLAKLAARKKANTLGGKGSVERK